MNKSLGNISIIIPSLEPDASLINYINDLISHNIQDIIVIDDGSGIKYKNIFNEISEMDQCTVITHEVNKGKGEALKRAFKYVSDNRPNSRGVITVDCDGQHAVKDVCNIARVLLEDRERVILGCRDFSNANTPIKSKIGNRCASTVMFLTHGKWFKDTQTGLRGFGDKLLPLIIETEGSRFEYEMNVLTSIVDNNVEIVSVEIDTIYENNNAGTHFRPIKDSIDIISVIMKRGSKFLGSSMISSVVDISLAWMLLGILRDVMPGQDFLRILAALLIARVCSMSLNYTINKNSVFKSGLSGRTSFVRYLTLCIGILALSVGSVYIGSVYFGWNENLVKIISDTTLFILSYKAQKNWVFKENAKNKISNSILIRNVFLAITVVLTTIYLTWRVLFTIPTNDGLVAFIFGIMLVSAEVITAFTTFELYYRKIKSTNLEIELPEVDEDEYPHVDVFIATHNEDLELLYKTGSACTFMEYPDKNKVHIYFCDDGNRDEVRKLADRLGIGYLGLAENKHAKSGNLNNALEKTNSPLIATFDADMIPQRTFLMKTVPYFFVDTYIKGEDGWRLRTEEELEDAPKMGLVQTPQSFYNPDLFQFNLYAEDNIPNEQDFFSREVNIMRNSANAVAYTGSNTVISRKAMEDIGGFPFNTITEDFETSVRIQKEKYITYATSEVQAAGLTTTTFKSMIKQRKRWAQGVIQSLQNTNAIFTRKLPLQANISYLCGYLYWWSFLNRMVFIMAPIMFALFGFQVMEARVEELLILWLPSYICYSLSFKYLFSNIRTNRWSQIIDTIFAPYMIWCVILESLGIHERKFKVTNKGKEEESNFKYAIPQILLFTLNVFAFIKFSYGKFGWSLLYSSIILFWLIYNLSSLSYALFFMCGRKTYRKTERINVKEKVDINIEGEVFKATTINLSEGGMLFSMEKAAYIPKDIQIDLHLYTETYGCDLKGTIAYVKKVDDKWHYAMEIEPVTEEDKRQYLQIIYDRHHTLPTIINEWSTIYDDVYRNIERRIKNKENNRRKLIRVSIDQEIELNGGIKGYMHDFNYEYATISGMHIKNSDTVYELALESETALTLIPTEVKVDRYGARLFKVINTEEIVSKNIGFETLTAMIKRSKTKDKIGVA